MPKVCPAALVNRACSQPSCPFSHTVYRCPICHKPFASDAACVQHETSFAHSARSVFRCPACSLICTSQVDYESHVRGRSHRNKVVALASTVPVQPQPVQLDVPANHKPCEICSTFVPEKTWKQHIKGRKHRVQLDGQTLARAVEETETSEYDVQFSCDSINFGVINGSSNSVTAYQQIKIVNGGSSAIVITSARLSRTTQGDIFQVVDGARVRQLNRTNATTIRIKLTASKNDRGIFENRLEVHFRIPSQGRRFAVTRPVTARLGSKSDYETLKVTKPYVTRSRTRRSKITRFSPGIRPQALAKIVWVRKLEEYGIPGELEAILSQPDMKTSDKTNMVSSIFLPEEFGPSSYAMFMEVKLWVEEEQASRELSEYDMQGVTLNQMGRLYELRVPGLAEKRPSVIFGDRFFVKEAASPDALPFEGYVHGVRNTSVLLCFNKKFKWSIRQKYDVRFDLNRLVFRRMHQALAQVTEANRIAFPGLARELQPLPSPSVLAMRLYDSKIQNNEPQRRAVTSIVHMPAGSIPFIIYGPPGTGKTVTLVEAIRQVIERNPSARVLACAPSNSAADIIVERLRALDDKTLFRYITPSRSPGTVSPTVIKYTRTNEHDVFVSPPCEELKAFRVVVSTCCSGGVPYGIGFEPGHFTHIFVDEAAQATEPEVMIPIMTMLGPRTNVILSGDVKQLGPIVRSPIARELGLGMSLAERLMSTPVYDESRAKGRSMVKLTKNYRSHSAILEFPNQKFYKDELEVCASREITHCISEKWDGLVKRDYPVVFHGVCGQDLREDPSPSYFNIDEATIVKDYVKSLLGGNLQLDSSNIGVITPYRAQVLKIRQLLRTFAPDTRVGSVEEFQGQERKVIIISTVRSSPDMITFDLRHTLGFVANPRRFNVAVTRAQALLIVVGDPFVLALDPMWKEFINHVVIRGGYTGSRLDWNPEDPVDYEARLDEVRCTQGLADLQDLIRRIRALDMGDDDFEDNAPFREEE